MTAEEKVQILAVITTSDESGQHFMRRYAHGQLRELEAEGLVAIKRPVHGATGIAYSEEYWSPLRHTQYTVFWGPAREKQFRNGY